MDAFPSELLEALKASSLEPAGKAIATFMLKNDLQWHRSDPGRRATYQVYRRVGARAHPLLTLQPPPNNPDIPFQKMRGLPWSPFSGKGVRKWQVARLNRVVSEGDEKDPSMAAEKMYKIKWALFADPRYSPAIFEQIQTMIDRINQGA